MRIKHVEENGNVTLITGSFFGELNLTVTSKKGELIQEFDGAVSELKEMQNLFPDEQQNEKRMTNPDVKLDSSEFKSSLKNIKDTNNHRFISSPKRFSIVNKENLEEDDEVELLNDKETNVYKIVNEKGALLSCFKKGTVVKMLDGLFNTQDSKGFRQCLSGDCLDDCFPEIEKAFNLATDCDIVLNIDKGFKDITLCDKKDREIVIDVAIMGDYLCSENKFYKIEDLKPCETEPVSDKKAQKFFKKEIERAKGGV